MKGSEWVKTLPATAGPEREQAILDAVLARQHLPVQWCDVTHEHNGHRVVLLVGSDALAIGEPDDYVRVNVSARTTQKICDVCRWCWPTTRLVNLICRQAEVRLVPQLQPSQRADRVARGYSPDMSDTEAMLRHSRDVDSALGDRLPGVKRLIEPAGKHWVLCNVLAQKSGRAANYGWFSATALYRGTDGQRLWQPLSTTHNLDHTDYSQTLRPVQMYCLVDGARRLVAEVASDPELWPLVSDEPLKLSRLPGVAGPAAEPALPPAEPMVTQPSALCFTRTLRLHTRGPDVGVWQSFLGVGADGSFGPITKGATRVWQAAQGLVADGVVGPRTVARANQELVQRAVASAEGKPLISRFTQAKNYTPGTSARVIDWIVLHSAELPETRTGAEVLAAWAAGPAAPKASWHYAVDSDSITQSVRDQDVAWHAPGANGRGIGIEFCGYARQTAAEWRDEYSQQMLLLGARLVRSLCQLYQVPVVFRDAKALTAGLRGITMHRTVSDAFKKSDHWDPGPNFPMDWFLGQVINEG